MLLNELPDSQLAALDAKAASQGLTPRSWPGQLAGGIPPEAPRQPNENRGDMFRAFAQDRSLH